MGEKLFCLMCGSNYDTKTFKLHSDNEPLLCVFCEPSQRKYFPKVPELDKFVSNIK